MSEQDLASFRDLMVTVIRDEAKLKELAETAKDPEGLQRFAEANGQSLSRSDAERIFASATEFAASKESQDRISDEMLEGVTGGMSFAGWGAIGGGAAGAICFAAGVLSVVAAPISGGTSIGAFMALSGSAMAGLVAGSAAAGAVGAGAGAIAGHLIDES